MVIQSGRMTVGGKIAQLRAARGWSMNELARRSGLNPPTLQKIETGKTEDPGVSMILAIARALAVTVEQIVGRSGPGQSFEISIGGGLMGVIRIEALNAVRPSSDWVEDFERVRERIEGALLAAGLEPVLTDDQYEPAVATPRADDGGTEVPSRTDLTLAALQEQMDNLSRSHEALRKQVEDKKAKATKRTPKGPRAS